MNQITDAKIEIKSNIIYITKGDASLSISMESKFWKNEENRKVMFEIYPELKRITDL